VVAPAATPAAIIARLNSAINEGLKSTALEAAFTKLAVEPRTGSPEDFAAFLARERERWSVVIKAAGVKVE
jgi:tripartite-type tricarboxylate transporter receptor subunit TctC